MILPSFYLLCTYAFLLVVTVSAASDYHEQLVIQPLFPSNLLASFNFRSNESTVSFNQHNFELFPRSLGQILQHADTKELHLRFTTGHWDAERWGERPWHGFKEGGTGVELWAWIEAPTSDAAFDKWTTLTQSLSGLFCASLNFIDATRTTRPVHTFQPVGNHSNTEQGLYLLHGTLPGEVVCTENLTPFVKLLPCNGKVGISTLLDGHRIYDASWQSMAIDVRPTYSNELEEYQMEIDQTIDMVLDNDRAKRPRDNPIPRPVPVEDLVCDQSKSYNSDDTCYPVDSSYSQTLSLTEVFGKRMPGGCPLTGDDDNSIRLNIPESREILTTLGAYSTKAADGNSVVYSLSDVPFDFTLEEQESPTYIPLEEPVLHAERTIIGHGQERGGLRSILTNPSNTSAVDFVYFESLPWFMKPYLHTMKTEVAHRDGSSVEVPSAEIIKDVAYRPALDRRRGTQLELIISVPAASTVTLIYEFEKAILRYTEYPPDANRGFNVAPAIIRVLDSGDNKYSPASTPIYLRTTNLLLSLPTPDFSMPYNVIILTSTVIALAFGNIFNLLVRRFVAAEEIPPKNIKAIVLGKIAALKDKLRGKSAKVE